LRGDVSVFNYCVFECACWKVPVCAISKLMLITARTKELRVVRPSSVALWRTKWYYIFVSWQFGVSPSEWDDII